MEITNFSTSWSNGLALAALIHSMNPQAFNYDALKPSCPVDNFDTALKAAERLEVKGHLVCEMYSHKNDPITNQLYI